MSLPFLKKEFNFDLSNELIEKLIEVFKSTDYPSSDTTHVHRYHWPDVVLTDRIFEPLINDYLGTYQFTKTINGEIENEGQVFIYYDKIKVAAENYLKSDTLLYLTLSEAFEAITAIVLVHEFVHWIMHQIIGFNPLKYESLDSKDFHEGFAEFFTWYIIKEYPYLITIFEWLLPTEKDSPYLKHKELIVLFNKRFNIGNEENPLINIFKVINLLRAFDEIDSIINTNLEGKMIVVEKENVGLSFDAQSFKRLKSLLNLQDENPDNKEEEYWGKLIRRIPTKANESNNAFISIFELIPEKMKEGLINYKMAHKFKV